MTTETLIHPTLVSFLQEQHSRGAFGTQKRAVFPVEVQPGVVGLVLLDSSSGDLEISQISEDPSTKAVNLDGRIVQARNAPFAGPDTILTRMLAESGDLALEEEVMDSDDTSEDEEGEDEPTAVRELSAEEGVAAELPLPTPKKRGRKPKGEGEKKEKKAKGRRAKKVEGDGAKRAKKAVKAAKASLTAREKVVKDLFKKLGLDGASMPSPEAMFRLVDRPGNKKIPASSIAIFCAPDKVAGLHGPKAYAVNALAEIAGETMNSSSNNITNLKSEVNPARVQYVAKMLIELGVLIEEITVATIDPETVPEHLKDVFDPTIPQCIAGRHRVASLVMLYGPDVEIPCRVLENVDYEFAARATVTTNDTRAMGKIEAVYYNGLMKELVTTTPEAEFKRSKGSVKALTSMVAYHAITREDDVFGRCQTRVLDAVGKGSGSGITMPTWLNFVREVISSLISENEAYASDWETCRSGLTAAVRSMDALYTAIPKVDPNYPEAGAVWTNYGATAMGKLMGEALRVAMRSDASFSVNDAAAQIAAVMVSLAKQPGGIQAVANLSNKRLYPVVVEHAQKTGLPLMLLPKTKFSM